MVAGPFLLARRGVVVEDVQVVNKDAGSALDVLFVPISKVDVARREVYGVAAEERADRTKEAFDYASSKPHFKEWSAEFDKATGGKSKGNLRAMHQPKAVGKVVDMVCDDATKRIMLRGKVVDDAEWQKVEEGVYTGFSIGGKYLKRWTDPSQPDVTRYTARPAEISLVDNPCMYGAHFEVLKGEGIVEERTFHPRTAGSFIITQTDGLAKVTGAGLDEPQYFLDVAEALRYVDGLNKMNPNHDERGDVTDKARTDAALLAYFRENVRLLAKSETDPALAFAQTMLALFQQDTEVGQG